MAPIVIAMGADYNRRDAFALEKFGLRGYEDMDIVPYIRLKRNSA